MSVMAGGLSEDEWNRIERFAETPAYEREPEQLLPDQADEADSG